MNVFVLIEKQNDNSNNSSKYDLVNKSCKLAIYVTK
jgi:hypothetical protein